MDVEELQKELDKFKPNIEGKSVDELPLYEVLYNDYEQMQKTLTEKETQHKKDLENQKKQINTIITQLTNKSVDNSKLQAEITELKKNMAILSSPSASPMHDRSNEEIKPLKAKIRELEEENLNLQQRVKELEEENEKLKQANSEYKNNEKSMEENLKQVEDMAIEAKTENAKIKSDKEMYCFQLQKLVKEIKAKNLEVNINI